MIIAAFIVSIVAILISAGALYISWKTYERDSAKLSKEQIEKENAAEPLFVWRGGSANPANLIEKLILVRDFVNKGGPVTNLSIISTTGIQASINRGLHLDHNEEGKIELRAGISSGFQPVSFEIHYETQLGIRNKISFIWANINDGPKVVRS